MIEDEEQDIADQGIMLWNRERPDIDCSGKAVTGRILRLAEMMMDAMNANMTPFGVKYSTYAIVATLRAAGPPYRMSPSQLQHTLIVTSGGVSNLLRKVEEMGLVERHGDPLDGRGRIVQLTPKGFELTEKTMIAQADIERQLVKSLSRVEQEMLASLLKRLILRNQIA